MAEKQIISAAAWGAAAKSNLLTLPSGAVVEVKRPGPEVYLKFGQMPQALVSLLVKTKNPDQLEHATVMASFAQLSDEEFKQYMLFARDIVAASVVRPKIVVGATGEDEIDPSDIPPGDFWHLVSWAALAARGIPVQTTKGDTTVEAVETFRPEQGVSDALSGSVPLPPEAQPNVRPTG